MPKHVFMFFSLLLSSVSFAQNARLDSIRQEISMKKIKNDTTYVKLLIEQCQEFSNWGHQDSSMLYAKRALKIAENESFTGFRIKALLEIGNAASEKNNFKEASEYFFIALRLAEKENDISGLAQASKGIAFSYIRGGDGKNGRKWLIKAANFYRQLKQERYVALCNMSIGTCYQTDSLNEEALPYFEKALKSGEQLKDDYVISVVKSNYAISLGKLGRYKEAIAMAESNLPYLEGTRNPAFYGSEYTNLADYYGNFGNYQKSIYYGEKGLKIAQEYKMWGPIKASAINLSNGYEQLKNHEKALSYYKIYLAAKDSLDVRNIKDKTETLELKYEAENRNLEIENLNKTLENRRLQQYWLGSGILFLSFLGIGFYLSNRSLNKKNKLIESQKREIQNLNSGLEDKVKIRTLELEKALEDIKGALSKGQKSERKRLASDLHDNLGSVLSAINMNIEAIDPSSLSEKERKLYHNIKNMTADAYQEVRLISHNLSPKELEQQGLANALTRLTEKLNQAQKTQFDFKNGLKNKLPEQLEINLYSISMEVCNNILKHSEASKAVIHLGKKGTDIFLKITDNGTGISEDIKKGFGFINIQERTSAINGKLNIRNVKSGGTSVEIKIHLA